MKKEKEPWSPFVLIFAAAIGGFAGGSWWVFIPLCVAGLSIVSLPKYLELWPRAQNVGAEGMWWKTVGLSVLNGAGAASAGFVFGAVVRLLG